MAVRPRRKIRNILLVLLIIAIGLALLPLIGVEVAAGLITATYIVIGVLIVLMALHLLGVF